MQFLDALNPAQREAVERTDGPLLIIAGAGSGKTRVITSRIAYLIGNGLAPPDGVLAVTFTNKAAEEMRERVQAAIGGAADRAWISTFHAFCARVLRREATALGLSRNFVIYDSVDQLAAVRHVMRGLGIDEKLTAPRVALSRISQAKNRMEAPEAMQGSSWSYRDEQIAKVYEGYARLLTESGALDFDDLLLKTVQLFDEVETVRHLYARQFRYTLIDEYQDTNRPQYLLVRQLASAYRNVCVVGDPDQSIYKWRGADVRNILDFERDFPDAHIVKLEQNYRSTQVILDAASAVVSHNRNRKGKQLWTERRGGAKVLYRLAADEIEEADFIVRTARGALSDPNASVAVLYRTNAQSRAIEDAFNREGLPYRIVGSVRFYERKEIKDALAYLKLVINPHDDVSLRRVINVPARGIGKTLMESLEGVQIADASTAPLLAASGLAGGPRASLWAKLLHAVATRQLSARATTSLATVRDLVARLADVARTESVSVTVARVLDLSGYLNYLREEHSEDAEARMENLAELVSAAGEYETRDPEATLAGLVDRLSLLSEADETAGAAKARVWLMTLHAAKGLEFPMVVMAGMEEGLCPHTRSTGETEDLEEERRLCYVGMTRAQSRLVLTVASRRRTYGEYEAREPSRFLDEIPDALVERQADPYGSNPGFSAQRAGHGGLRDGNPSRPPPARDAGGRPAFAYEDEDQSSPSLRLGSRVRHPLFGIGTVVGVEHQADDVKITVRFAGVGQKKLLARFARLEPA